MQVYGFNTKLTFQIGPKKIFVIKKYKNTVPWTYLIKDLTEEEII